MKFCTNCHNMYYLQLNSENKPPILQYICRYCQTIENMNMDDVEDKSILQIDYNNGGSKENSDEMNIEFMINEFTKYDPTLPRIQEFPCPNDKCSSHQNNSTNLPEIIYVRYNTTQMKYAFLCTVCDHHWKL